MKHYNFRNYFRTLFLLFLTISLSAVVRGQISFSQNALDLNGFTSITNGTALDFGPDGRLYVADYRGLIKAFTIQRNGPGNYVVLNTEDLDGVKNIPDHNDDGSTFNSPYRETLGIKVMGTAANPEVYVCSSDFRIGGFGSGGNGDSGLDTNSGIITRMRWTGTAWDVVDLVRGLPRSEENHGTNGLDFARINGTDYLIVGQGGHTNAGSPSRNFAFTGEYALTAALLAVNLTQLNAMAVSTDNGRKYIYDLPTLDDPTRANINGITDPNVAGYNGVDVNDPFGGNDGLNQAMIVPGGPVQIFSPGHRNIYDLVVTQSGAVYVTDNGANQGWGGFPVGEGTANVTNNYDPLQPGSSSESGGEAVNNQDNLKMVTNQIQTYTFGSFYGGHTNPTRANPLGSGIYWNPAADGTTTGAVFRTQPYDPNGSTPGSTTNPNIALPANWPPVPVSMANPVEGDWRGPGITNPDGDDSQILTIWGTNTNAIDEYTASNFNGALQGDLIAGVNTGVLRRVELNPDGSMQALTDAFLSGIGGNALGVNCNSDTEIFAGSIWVVTLEGTILVFEPQDFIICNPPSTPGYNTADYDFDGYTNLDEDQNGTDPCNGGSQPNDFDKGAGGTLVSDLNDADDDADGIPDASDPFQLGNPLIAGNDAFPLPVYNDMYSSNTVLKGYLGLGFTGLMNNGAPNPNWLQWLDRRDDVNDPNPNDILGGAIGAMTMQMTAGTAAGAVNTQEKGFQYGVQVNQTTEMFTISSRLMNFNSNRQLYHSQSPPNAELGIFLGDGTQDNYIKFVLTPAGLTARAEVNNELQAPVTLAIATNNRPDGSITFHIRVNPTNGQLSFLYSFDGGPSVTLGTMTATGAVLNAIQQTNIPLAVGLIGSSNLPGTEIEGTWDYLNVVSGTPTIAQDLPDLHRYVYSPDEAINLNNYFNDDNGKGNLAYSITGNTNSSIGAAINGTSLSLSYPSAPGTTIITIRATDADSNFVEQSFNVEVVASPVVFRINSGGPQIAAIDGDLDWSVDTEADNSPYLVQAETNNTSLSQNILTYDSGIDTNTTPLSIFNSVRFDTYPEFPNVSYSFPVTLPGMYEVRIYLGDGLQATSEAGQRIFDVEIEGVIYPDLDNIDLSGTYGFRHGIVISHTIEVQDGFIDISIMDIGTQNALIRGIEVIEAFDSETPITINPIADQSGLEGEQLDGSLFVQASGGEGNLQYTAVGLPPGLVIEPTNGQIGGTIAAGAASGSPYTVTITVDDNDGNSNDSQTVQFTWIVQEAGTGTGFELYINAGGPSVNHNGQVYEADQYFTGGYSFTNTNAQVPPLYQTERSSDNRFYNYDIPIPNGTYTVTLHFAEIYWNATGGPSAGLSRRLFDVSLENDLVLDDYNITGDVGVETPVTKSYVVTVSDNELNMYLTGRSPDGGKHQPLLSAFSVTGGSSGNQPPVAVASVSTQSGPAPLSVTFTGINSTDDSGISTYHWDFGDGSTADIANPQHTYQTEDTFTATLTVTDGGGLTDEITLDITVGDPPSNGYSLYINTGGPSVNHNGQVYEADQYFTGGYSFTNTNAQVPPLYQTERSSDNRFYNYDIPIPNGTYTVTLHFAEIYWNATGGPSAGLSRRLFDVSLEDDLVLDDYNITGDVGVETPVTKSYVVTVSDNELNMYLTGRSPDGGKHQPLLSAFSIVGSSSGPQDPIADAGPDQDITLPTNSVVFNGSGNDPDGGQITAYSWSQLSGPNSANLSGSATSNLTAGNLVEGTYVFQLTVTDDEDATASDDVSLVVFPAPGGGTSIRINTGGSEFTFNGDVWTADQFFSGGNTFARNNAAIANTTNDILYRSERYTTSGTLIYNIPVASGTFDVDLHFAEIYFGAVAAGGPGSRVFDIDIENGQAQRSNYDIIVAAGGSAMAVIESFSGITVNDGNLTITLTSVVENAKISGMEVNTSAGLSAKSGTLSETTAASPDSLGKKESVIPYGIQVYPNPTEAEFRIFSNDPVSRLHKVYVFDDAGRIIRVFDAEKGRLDNTLYRFNIEELEAGIYTLSVTTDTETKYHYRLVLKK